VKGLLSGSRTTSRFGLKFIDTPRISLGTGSEHR
jgi:hypothetical protein